MSAVPPVSGRHRSGRSPARQRVAIAVVAGTVATVLAATAVAVAAATDGARGWLGTSSRLSVEPSARQPPPGTPTAPPSPSGTASPAPTESATATSSPVPAGEYGRPAGTSPQVTVTEIDLGVSVTGYGGEGSPCQTMDMNAAYFGVAITVQNGNCVDIHQGDRMQVVDASGSLVSGQGDSFEAGCSHAWTSRIDGTLFGGDLVLASTSGYWTAWSQGGEVRLEHFTTGASDITISTSTRSSHPHLVSYATGRMLLAWEAGSSIAAQV